MLGYGFSAKNTCNRPVAHSEQVTGSLIVTNRGLHAMKKTTTILGFAIIALTLASPSWAAKPPTCETIQSGNIYAPDGSLIEVGYDVWGYNYQARKFAGYYCDAYRDAGWCQPFKDDKLAMKWNDAWLDNKDCDHDGLLDRHYGFDSYIGSGAWLTNHMSGNYEDDGEDCSWLYFVKIVAVPDDASLMDGHWYTADGDLIGDEIWDQFAVIQEVSNDSCLGEHGVQVRSPVGPGLGRF
jgi:hypothetical protein